MKIEPQVKQLNKDKRRLEKTVTQQQARINQLELHCKNIRINFYMYFMQYLVKDLTVREKKILTMRFGFDDGVPKTLEEVAEEFGVNRERIRQIQAKATEKVIRHNSKEWEYMRILNKARESINLSSFIMNLENEKSQS